MATDFQCVRTAVSDVDGSARSVGCDGLGRVSMVGSMVRHRTRTHKEMREQYRISGTAFASSPSDFLGLICG